MSNCAAKLARVEPVIDHGHMRTQQHYPRHLVLWGVLSFCLSVWGVVILGVTQFA